MFKHLQVVRIVTKREPLKRYPTINNAGSLREQNSKHLDCNILLVKHSIKFEVEFPIEKISKIIAKEVFGSKVFKNLGGILRTSPCPLNLAIVCGDIYQ